MAGQGARPRQGLPRYIMPEAVMELFRPRDPLPYLPPRRNESFLKQFNDEVSQHKTEETTFETPAEKKKRRKEEEVFRNETKALEQYLPPRPPNATTDPHKTLFIAKLRPETAKLKLLAELETYGKVNDIKLPISKKTGLPKGFAFVEFQRERDAKEALRALEGRRIDGARVLVDIERARTVKSWLPKKLRINEQTPPKVEKNHPSPPPPNSTRERFSSPPSKSKNFRSDNGPRYRRNRL
eukprot:jgi/Galph1/3078/GphlegSOOS_G1717.1